MAALTLALSDSHPPLMGMVQVVSKRALTSGLRPWASLPTASTQASGQLNW